MDYNSINTQWYSLEEKDVCQVDLKLGHVTFKDKSFNTKGLRMDSNTLIVAIYEALGSLVVTKEKSHTGTNLRCLISGTPLKGP